VFLAVSRAHFLLAADRFLPGALSRSYEDHFVFVIAHNSRRIHVFRFPVKFFGFRVNQCGIAWVVPAVAVAEITVAKISIAVAALLFVSIAVAALLFVSIAVAALLVVSIAVAALLFGAIAVFPVPEIAITALEAFLLSGISLPGFLWCLCAFGCFLFIF
jgi:hypothetical protein